MRKAYKNMIEAEEGGLTLRDYQEDDYDFIHDTTRDNMGEFVARHQGGWNPIIFKKEIEKENITIVERAGKCVAFFDLKKEEGAFRLRNIQVAKAEQGRGIGDYIMTAVEARGKEAGIGKIRLSVFIDNPAVDFYKKRGFDIVGGNESTYFMEKVSRERTAGNGNG